MTTDRNLKTDKELWRSLATGPVASDAVSGAVSDMDFAAWLEGNLSETEAARIEAAVSSSPEMRLAAMDLAEILGMPLPVAPARMAVRAQALVGFEAERRTARGSWLASLLDGFALPRAGAVPSAPPPSRPIGSLAPTVRPFESKATMRAGRRAIGSSATNALSRSGTSTHSPFASFARSFATRSETAPSTVVNWSLPETSDWVTFIGIVAKVWG